jgi:hypothetical protein
MEPVGSIGDCRKVLTVHDAINILEDLPDDMEIWIDVDGEYFFGIRVISSGEKKDGTPCVIIE